MTALTFGYIFPLRTVFKGKWISTLVNLLRNWLLY